MSDQAMIVRTGFAGAMALAAGSGAYGAIVVIAGPANLPNAASPTTAGPISFDVNGDAVNDFVYSFRNPQSAGPGNGVIWQANFAPVVAAGTNAVLGFLGPFVNYGTNLGAATLIGATTPAGASWRNPGQVVLGSVYRSNGVISGYGGFAAGGTNTGGGGRPSQSRGFLGLRFDIGGQTRYAWLDVEVIPATSAAGSGGFVFHGGAYEDSGASIAAGAVPAPGAVAVMALGAAGLLRRSRREN